MTVSEYQAGVIRGVGAVLAHTVSAMPEERLDWHPSADAQSKSRSALDLISECITVNRECAARLRGETPPPRGEGRPFSNGQEAQTQVQESANDLAASVAALDEEGWNRIHTLPFGPIPATMLVQITTGNMQYHFGQINFIQTLYGDMEFHLPPTLFSK